MKHFEIPLRVNITVLAESREEAISLAQHVISAGVETVGEAAGSQLLSTSTVVDHPNIKEKDNPYA